MISTKFAVFLGSCALLCSACNLEHHAPLRSAELPPLAPTVLHANRLWLDLSGGVPENRCVVPRDARPLCFEKLRRTLGIALERSLWSSFPGVELAGRGESAPPGDYVLHVDLDLGALPPDPSGPGWSANASGSWRLERAGTTLAGERVTSRSRSEFAYGSELGTAASEVIDAIAVRIGMNLGGVPELRVLSPIPLPEVATAPLDQSGPIPAASREPTRRAL